MGLRRTVFLCRIRESSSSFDSLLTKMASLYQAWVSSSATPLLLAKRVFSLASSPFICTSGHKIRRHYSSFRASASASASTSDCVDLKEVRSNNLVELEYAELNLNYKITEEVGHVRIRQHVNPLSSSFSTPAPVPAWEQVYKDPSLPLMVDIGSGSGRFLLWLAKKDAESRRNHLGLEIRQKLVKRANFWVNELGLSNVHFIYANATVSFDQLISSYPGPLELVSILCPDPHFKKRHHKRRVVQKPLVNSILQNLKPGGKIFVQSDVLEVAQDMRDQLDEEAKVLRHVDTVVTEEGWLVANPMGIRTEREIHAELEGAKIYRRLYRKQDSASIIQN